MKKLFICETPFQIIVALNIKEQTSNNDLVDLILTDSFNGVLEIADRIRKMKIFNEVFTVNININNKLKKLKKLGFVFCTKKYLEKVSKNNFQIYDELFFWNYDSLTTSIRSYLYRKNKNLKVFLFEEGYISYFPYSSFKRETLLMKIITMKNRIYKISLSRNNIDAFFLYEPDLLLYDCKIPIRKIDKSFIYTEEFKNNIKNIFNLKEVNEKYDRKYIIFEEYHPEYDDENIFHKIIEKVGNNNVIIKLHPRRKENRFENENVKIITSDGIPWEAVALLGNFSDKILISIGSGSITSHRILLGENMHAYLLFKFMGSKLREFSDDYISFWNSIESKDESKGVHIPVDENNFFEMLEKENINEGSRNYTS